MKKPIDFNTAGEDELPSSSNPVESVSASQEELKLANISTTQRPIADAMVPLFGEEVACLVFARAWANREKGISQVIDKME
jgi:predicted nucleic acid binding AN1-type Zn finger protein